MKGRGGKGREGEGRREGGEGKDGKGGAVSASQAKAWPPRTIFLAPALGTSPPGFGEGGCPSRYCHVAKF